MKTFKKISAVCVALLLTCQLSACSSKTTYTEKEIRDTVNSAFTALSKFDNPQDVGNKISTDYINIIVTYAGQYPQVKALAKKIFSSLKWNIESVDPKTSSARVKVENKEMYDAAKKFLEAEKKENDGKSLMELFGSETWMNTELSKAQKLIDGCQTRKNETITVTISGIDSNKKVVLSADNANTVTGDVTTAIKEVFSGNNSAAVYNPTTAAKSN